MLKYLSLLLLLTSLFAEEPDSYVPLVDFEGTPNAVIDGCVNVISGDYCESQKDLIMTGTEPLILERSYSSSNPGNGTLCQGWEFNLQGYLRINYKHSQFYQLKWRGSFGSTLIYNTKQKSLGFPFNSEMLLKGLSNNATGIISGKTNLKNTSISYRLPDAKTCMLHKGDGSKLIFEEIREFDQHYRLRQDIKPNQMSVVYSYNEGVNYVSDIAILNPSSQALQAIHFDYNKRYSKHAPALNVFANDGRNVQYLFTPFIHFTERKEKFITYGLGEVISPGRIKETYTYAPIGAFERIVIKSHPESRYRGVVYYTPGEYDGVVLGQDNACMGRVRSIVAPIGTDASPITKYTFNYHLPGGPEKGGFCAVFDACRSRKDYFWDDEHRLTAIVRYKDGSPASSEHMYWGPSGSINHGNLTGRAFFCGTEPIFCRNYHYDFSGNVTCESIFGNLTGLNPFPLAISESGIPYETGCDRYDTYKVYSQDGMNLLLQETCGNHSKSYLYYPGTDLLAAAFTLNGYEIILRHCYVYDENRSLILEIVDNGGSINLEDLSDVTYRKLLYITPRKTFPLGLPESIEERYQDPVTREEMLLKAVVNSYSPEGYLLKQDHYDSNRQFLYSLEWEYDALGNVTFQKNALGETYYRRYDANGNKTFEQGPRGDYYKEYIYDFSNRLIREDEIHGIRRHSKHYRYDLLGQKTSSIDWYGNETNYRYDEFGNKTAEIFPAIIDALGQKQRPSNAFAYDGLGRVIQKIDPNGNATSYKYTARNQPCEITYPDGSQERFVYYNHGPLHAKTDRNGCSTIYIRDHLDRVIVSERYAPDGTLLSTKMAEYDALHLLSETDEIGITTYYSYDFFGRVKSISKGTSLELFEYDSLNRLAKKSIKCQENNWIIETFLYDFLDRVLQERKEDELGNVLSQNNYSYDIEGNRTLVITYGENGPQIQETRYNSYGIPNEIIDALGNVTKTYLTFGHYNEIGQVVFCSETVDPLGNSTVLIKDAIGRESIRLHKNSLGDFTQLGQIYYDVAGNRSKAVETVFSGNTSRLVINYWTFDNMGNVVGCTEGLGTPEQKHTKYFYNHIGQLWKIEKPDGIQINHDYTSEGQLKHYYSSDGTVDYVYNYDRKLRLISCHDLVYKRNSLFAYDGNDNLVEERLANGIVLKRNYDNIGRVVDFILPDASSIHYTHNSVLLKKISRIINNAEAYSHSYDHFDLCQKPLRETLVCSHILTKSYDKKDRLSQLETQHLQESIPIGGYDAAGNLRKRELTDSLGKVTCDYNYDSLYQLTNETGLVSHNYTFDSLHNLIKKDNETATHNSLNQLLSLGENKFDYDSNGNLIHSVTLEGETFYSYDALDRLIKVTKNGETACYSYDASNRRLTKQYKGRLFNYIYDGQNEIGCMVEGRVIQFRTLGLGLGAEIGAAIGIEIDNITYTPLHDHFGNVVSLLNAQGQIVSSCRYSAFGEEQVFGKINSPWRYVSKRIDDETGLVYFGRRYYSPLTARWITKDPVGYEAGPNLYAYVSNRPLIAVDPYGLFETESSILGAVGGAIVETVVGAIEFGAGLIVGAFNGFIDPIGTVQNIISPPSSMESIAYDIGESIGQCVGLAAMAIPLAGPLKALQVDLTMGKAGANISRMVEAKQVAERAARAAEAAMAARRATVVAAKVADNLMKIEKIAAAVINPSAVAKVERLIASNTIADELSIATKTKSVFNVIPDINALSKAGQVLDRGGLTKAGRALDKHGNRPNSVFPKAIGNIASKNAQGQFELDNILTNPTSIQRYDTHESFGEVIDIITPHNGGVRFTQDGKMIGFLQPQKK